jgi:hypothetical protein
MLQASGVRTIYPYSIVKLADCVSFIGGILIFSAVVWFVYSINHAAMPLPGAMHHELSCLWDLSGTFSVAPGLERRCDSIGYSTLPLWIGIASVLTGALLRYANVKLGRH